MQCMRCGLKLTNGTKLNETVRETVQSIQLTVWTLIIFY